MVIVIICSIGILICVALAAIGVIGLYKDVKRLSTLLAKEQQTNNRQKKYIQMQDKAIDRLLSESENKKKS